MTPTTINKFALAKACVRMWNTQIIVFPNERERNSKPSCLSVESATIFLKSFSTKAVSLATIRVKSPKQVQIKILPLSIDPNRTITQIPAVTRVELCTSALTGVGAAIAAGNQLIKGHWALLVKATTTKVKPNSLDPKKATRLIEEDNQYTKIHKSNASPNRLVNKVNIPPFPLIQFW